MCISVFLWKAHPLYPFLLLLNRDEYYNRPTKAVEWWEGGEILGGRDGEAGGTWLACSRNGKLAFVTNFRETQCLPQAKSRGDLPVRFLQSKKSPLDFAKEVVKEEDRYNGFNLILADLCSKTMVYVTNRPAEGNGFITEVTPGIHVLTNARLDSPWPKALRLRHGFEELLDKYGEGQVPIEEMAGGLMTNTVKDEESLLPGIYSPEREYNYSSIFVDYESPRGHYGTRSTTALSVKHSGEVRFYEKYLENEVWKENTLTYDIEQTRAHFGEPLD